MGRQVDLFIHLEFSEGEGDAECYVSVTLHRNRILDILAVKYGLISNS